MGSNIGKIESQTEGQIEDQTENTEIDEENTYEWTTSLGKLTNYPEFRAEFEGARTNYKL